MHLHRFNWTLLYLVVTVLRLPPCNSHPRIHTGLWDQMVHGLPEINPVYGRLRPWVSVTCKICLMKCFNGCAAVENMHGVGPLASSMVDHLVGRRKKKEKERKKVTGKRRNKK